MVTLGLACTDLERRFPNRLEKASQTAIEIVQTMGYFDCKKVGEGRLKIARLKGFYIIYYTPFNQPTAWPRVNWDDPRVRQSGYGLMISDRHGGCLTVDWIDGQTKVSFIRWSSKNNWDRRLRKIWREVKKHILRFNRSLDTAPN